MSTKTKLWKLLLRTAVCMPSLDRPVALEDFSFLTTAHDCGMHIFQTWRTIFDFKKKLILRFLTVSIACPCVVQQLL